MSGKISVNVDDLRAFHEAHEDDPSPEANEIRLALAEHDKSKQAEVEPVECPRCLGCGQIADSEAGEPWSMWLDLPVRSALAVTLGVVKPIDCPDCGGTGTVKP